MNEKKYQVTDKWGHILGNNMSLDMAVIFMKGITNEYYNENIHLCLVEQVELKKEEEDKEMDLAFQ